MNLAASFEFHAGGTAYRFRPLTVRERIGLSNAIVERERRKAVALAKELELSGAERVEFVSRAVSEAEKVSSVVLSCFTLEGSLTVLRLSILGEVSDVDRIAEAVEPGELSVVAARCLNVEIENPAKREEKKSVEGN